MNIDINYKILLVDDEQFNLKFLKCCFSNLGLRLFTTKDDNEAVNLTMTLKPDQVFVNWMREGLDGLEIVKRLKADPNMANIPVIIFPAEMFSIKGLQIAFDAGIVDFINPYSKDGVHARTKLMACMTKECRKNCEQLSIIYKQDYELMEQKNKILELELEKSRDKLIIYSTQIIKYNDMNKRMVADVMMLSDKLGSEGVSAVCNIINKYTLGAYKINWNEFEKLFDTVNSRFFSYLANDFPSLTTNEKKLCAYYRMNLSTKEIATLTYSNYEAVRKARNRLRKKMKLPLNVMLTAFLQQY
jgi:CheY-like chemotaxis protein/DNA-binding CsgD family transcriptional regulator